MTSVQGALTVATQDPNLFMDQLDVRSPFPIAIDECQKAPPLFFVLKLKFKTSNARARILEHCRKPSGMNQQQKHKE